MSNLFYLMALTEVKRLITNRRTKELERAGLSQNSIGLINRISVDTLDFGSSGSSYKSHSFDSLINHIEFNEVALSSFVEQSQRNKRIIEANEQLLRAGCSNDFIHKMLGLCKNKSTSLRFTIDADPPRINAHKGMPKEAKRKEICDAMLVEMKRHDSQIQGEYAVRTMCIIAVANTLELTPEAVNYGIEIAERNGEFYWPCH